MGRSDIVILIPCYNEESNIKRTINLIKKEYDNSFDIVVIDDCSTDDTPNIIKNISGILSYRNETNKGYEGTIEKGFQLLHDKYKYLITYDADGEHKPKYLSILYKHLKNNCKVVYGIRRKKNRMSEVLVGLISNILYKLPDPLSGLKGYHTSLYRENNHKFDTCKSVGMELLFFAKKERKKIKYFNMDVNKRLDISKFGSGLKTEILILKKFLNLNKC